MNVDAEGPSADRVDGPGVIFRVHGDENTEKSSRYERGSG
jgi:hypothetical protein